MLVLQIKVSIFLDSSLWQGLRALFHSRSYKMVSLGFESDRKKQVIEKDLHVQVW